MNKNVACICTISHEENTLPNVWSDLITKKNYDKFVLVDRKVAIWLLHEDINFHH
jgi:hypothetical protein